MVRRTKREREDSAREEAPERRVAEGVKAEMRGPAEAGPRCPDLRLRFAALLSTDLFRRHRVCEEILVSRCEAFRKLENLKAVAIADGPELDIG